MSRRALLGVAAGLAVGGPALAQTAPLTIGADYRIPLSRPDRRKLDAWVEALRGKVAGWWPTLTTRLGSPGFTPTRTVTVRFIYILPKQIPAATRGDVILVDPGELLARVRNPDTLGMIGHELVHVVQAYPKGQPPWLVEGIADYMRYYVLLPGDPSRYFDPASVDWRTGYQPTAGLLDFVERAQPGAVQTINAIMRQGGDGPAALAKLGGAPPDQLWASYMATRPAAADAAAAGRSVERIMLNSAG